MFICCHRSIRGSFVFILALASMFIKVTAPALAVEFVSLADDLGPLHGIKSFDNHILTGLGIASQVYPPLRAVNTVNFGINTALGISFEAVGARTRAHEGELLLINREAERLVQIKKEGRDLKTDPEARKLVAQLRQSVETLSTRNEYTFLARALESEDVLYAVAKREGRRRLSNLLGGKLGKFLGLHKVTFFYKLKRGPLTKNMTRTAWKRLRKLGRSSEQFTKQYAQALIVLYGRVSFDKWLSEKLDKAWKNVQQLRREQDREWKAARSGVPMLPEDFRLGVSSLPSVLIPIVETVPSLIALPARIAVPADPVTRMIAVDAQIREVQPQFRPDPPTSTPDYVDPDPGPTSHPLGGHNIDTDVGKHFGGSWDGGRGNLWN